MLTLLDRAIGFLAPHTCLACGVEGALLCDICLPLLPDIRPQCYRCHRTDNGATTCRKCRADSPLEQVWIRTPYDGFGEALIRSLKFERALAAADTIAQCLAQQFSFPANAAFIPVPTATSRVRQRGYDQTLMITKALTSYTGLPYTGALERHGQARQTGSSRKQRIAQLDQAFQAQSKKLRGSGMIILVDDVLTTGATLETAAKTLKQAGVKRISALTFARAE